MKNQIIFIFVIMCSAINIFPEERNIIEEKNAYGGRTIEQIFDAAERAKTNFSKLVQYYDSENRIVKQIFEPIDKITDTTGIKMQIAYYKNNIIEKYEMLFTDGFQNLYGYNRLIEEVNAKNVITRKVWYINDTIIDISELAEDKFSFYNIEFIEDELFDGYKNEKGGTISMSAKYANIRSVIKFDTRLYELDNNDIMLLNIFSTRMGADNFSRYYSKKVKVYSKNRSYWLYVQTQLEKYVLGQDATIRYYPIGFNREMYLICIGFFDIKK